MQEASGVRSEAAPLLSITDPAIGIVVDPSIVSVAGFEHPKDTRIVPNIDGKLGVNYSYQFCNAHILPSLWRQVIW